MSRRAIFLDRDGTLNEDVGYTRRVEDLRLVENAREGLRQFSAMGFELIIVTNQSGIARGYFGVAEMHAFNAALCSLLEEGGVKIAGIFYCPFHPTEGVGPYRRESPLRKPRPGMLLQAAGLHRIDLAASYAVGDKKSDILAGQAAGCGSILVQTGQAGRGEPHLSATADLTAADLLDAAEQIQRAARGATAAPHFPTIDLARNQGLSQPRGDAR